MNYITATDLRTKTVELIETLKRGGEVSLVHRSKVVGIIKPTREKSKKLTKAKIKKLQKLVKELNLPKTSYKERDRLYRKHLMEKYGKGLS